MYTKSVTANVADNERLLAIDSIALLGGNENLVQVNLYLECERPWEM